MTGTLAYPRPSGSSCCENTRLRYFSPRIRWLSSSQHHDPPPRETREGIAKAWTPVSCMGTMYRCQSARRRKRHDDRPIQTGPSTPFAFGIPKQCRIRAKRGLHFPLRKASPGRAEQLAWQLTAENTPAMKRSPRYPGSRVACPVVSSSMFQARGGLYSLITIACGSSLSDPLVWSKKSFLPSMQGGSHTHVMWRNSMLYPGYNNGAAYSVAQPRHRTPSILAARSHRSPATRTRAN